jgi:hypothetical protein
MCKVAQPTVLPLGKRIPGLQLDHPRQLALMQALVRFSHIAAQNSFTTTEIHADTLAALQLSPKGYGLGCFGMNFLTSYGLRGRGGDSVRRKIFPLPCVPVAADLAQDVVDYFLRTVRMKLRVHAAQRDSDDVAMVQPVAGTHGAQLQPQFVRQFDIFRPEARRMRSQVEEDHIFLIVEHDLERQRWPRFGELFPIAAY